MENSSNASAVGTDFTQLRSDLESQELNSGSSPCSPQLYSQLLALYLLENDMCNAKFLWKRIPQTVKQGPTELTHIWALGQKIWHKDFSGIYECARREWSDDVKDIMVAVLESVRGRALRLVQLAYSSIGADDFSVFVGMPQDKAIEAAEKDGWQTDMQTKFITPKKLEQESMPQISNEYLSVLTDYVTFMEN